MGHLDRRQSGMNEIITNPNHRGDRISPDHIVRSCHHVKSHSAILMFCSWLALQMFMVTVIPQISV